MNGLSCYPRSYGSRLPPHIAEALRPYLQISDPEFALYEKRYQEKVVPAFLQANSRDPDHQPGAVPRSSTREPIVATRLEQVLWPVVPDKYCDQLMERLRSYPLAELEEILAAFQIPVRAETLPGGTSLCRIVGVTVPTNAQDKERLRNGKFDPVNRLYTGQWWVLERTLRKFMSEAEMRQELALRTEWNGDHGVIRHVTSEPVAVLVGPAARQNSANPGLVFPGGGIQIYIPRGAFAKADGTGNDIHPLPWSQVTS